MSDIFSLFKRIEKEAAPSTGKPEWLIVGLGNPGREYEGTRHNTGFMALDAVAAGSHVNVERLKFKALTGLGTVGGHPVMLMKPQTYMNLSGESVRPAAEYYQIPPERILVLVDDVYQPVGRVRIRKSGSDGGHNGLGNIIYQLGSDRFPRIRFGVGEKPHPDYDMKDWVLGKFPPEDMKRLASCFSDVTAMAQRIMDGNTEEAMGQFNGKVYEP